MCWSLEASVALTAVGAGTTAYAAYKKDDPRVWAPLGYFTLMEALQAYTYTVIDDCGNPHNQVATVLGYIHVAFQPFFANMISLYFIPQNIAKKISPYVYGTVFVCTVLTLLSIYPFEFAKACDIGSDIFCGKQLCSVSGDWHIAWEMPRKEFWYEGFPYVFAAFGLPLLYGSWRVSIYHSLTGPLLAYMTTWNMNEFAAVWCLYSIGLLLIVVKTPIRKILHVKRWILYPKSMQKPD